MLVTHHLAHLGSSLTNPLNIESLALYLAQFDAETAQLHLSVDTSHILYLAVLIPSAEVSRMVHPYRPSPAIFLHKRTIDERSCRALRQPPIASSHLDAGKAQFASHTLRHEVARSINNEIPVVCHTLSYRDILHMPSRSNAIVRSVVSTLCRSIYVDDLDMVTKNSVHLLTATRSETYGQVVEGIEQKTSHSR